MYYEHIKILNNILHLNTRIATLKLGIFLCLFIIIDDTKFGNIGMKELCEELENNTTLTKLSASIIIKY